MRALVVWPGPNFSVTDVADKLAKGIAANGVETHAFKMHDLLGFYTRAHDFDDATGEYKRMVSTEDAVHLIMDQLKAALWSLMPDVVILVSGFFTDYEMLDFMRECRPHRTVGILTEQPYESDRELAFAEHLDAVVLNDPINVEQFRQRCPNSFYLPHSFDPDLHHANGRVERYDFGFVGTGYPSRVEFLEKVDLTGMRAILRGNWVDIGPDSPLAPFTLAQNECMNNRDTADLYRHTNCSVNLYRTEHNAGGSDVGWAMGPREVELAACGTFFARDPRPESDETFPMLPTITDPSELSDVIRWAKDHPAERRAAADAAREAVADRDCTSMAGHLLRHLGF